VRWFLASLAAVAGFTCWGGTLTSDSGAPPRLAQQVFCWVGAAAFVALAARTARLAVIVGDSAVVVRNVFRSYRLPWPEIASVAGPPPYGTRWRAGVQLRLRDGRTVSASAFVRGRIDGPDVGQELVLAIQEHLSTSGE
jgi:hypothetical protein